MTTRVVAVTLTVKQRLLLRTRARRALLQLRCSRFGFANLRDFFLDLRYGGYCGGIIPQAHQHPGAYRTQSTNYTVLDRIFRYVSIEPSDVLVDVGCGKGRVINYWLHRGYRNEIVGIEIDERIATEVRRRLAPFPNVTIVHGSALENLPEGGTLFYLYNPFDGEVFCRVMQRLLELSRGRPNLRVIYYVPRHAEMLTGGRDWEIRNLPMGVHRPALLVTARHT